VNGLGDKGEKKSVIDRMGATIGRTPRRAASIVLVLIVILILLAAVSIGTSGLLKLPKAPYKSEATPLSLKGNAVIWTESCTVRLFGAGGREVSFLPVANPGGWGLNWSTMKFQITIGDLRTTGGTVVSQSDTQKVGSGAPTTVRENVSGEVVNGTPDWFYLLVTDGTGNGTFDYGDSIVFVFPASSPIEHDSVYTLALASVQPGYAVWWEYSFAVHDGRFYSWSSSNFNTQEPWWAT
jgi:hypothetical protein